MNETYSVGIDVSKATLDVCLYDSDQVSRHIQVSNDQQGFKTLHDWLKPNQSGVHSVCLEATGRYSQSVATYLSKQNYPVSVVNPALPKAFGTALAIRHKTDKTDAYVLARYAHQMKPAIWQPRCVNQQAFQELNRLQASLQTDRTRQINRLEGLACTSPAYAYIQAQLALIETQLVQIEHDIAKLIDDDLDLQQQHALLISIPGIGAQTARQLLAELPDLSLFSSSKELVAYAGLYPHQHQSGTQLAFSYLAKRGNAHLRRILYFPALTAKVWNPHLCAFAQRLTEAGKPKMVVVVAVMRKLLVLVYTILKSRQPYNPNYGVSA